jgi:glutamyl-tRNA(Gln) amidotransferase subunit E
VEYDYGALGLKVGLEIHAQLNTAKLFCCCGSDLVDNQDFSIKRRLRPTMSELGEIDPAAKEEFKKNVMQLYKASLDNACLVYADEEPPHEPNPEAVHTLLQIATLLKAEIADQIHFMRKIVIDGSNVSGFQRTALVALDGIAYSEFGTVRIPTVCLEEDAARLIETVGRTKIWNMDRLGTPLVEIATDPSMHHPRQARDIALYLGQAMKATKRLKRGIGTIRQDVNISIVGGTRVEIKGVQELNLIEDCIVRECARQLALIGLKDELERRGVTSVNPEVIDISSVFEGTKCKIIKDKVFGIRLAGFAGLPGMEVQEGRRFGTEMADYAKKYVRGIFHSDELPKYGITQDEVDAVIAALGVGEEDAYVLVTEGEEVAKKALFEVVRRARLALSGVPPETRRALPDGNSQYMRPLPGKSRMYPETDVYPLRISKEQLALVERTLPELPSETLERLAKEYGLAKETASRILDWDAEELFVYSQQERGMQQSRFLRMMEMYTKLSREGVECPIDRDELLQKFIAEEADVTTDSFEDVLKAMMEKGFGVEDALSSLGITSVSSDEVRETISSIRDSQADVIAQRGKDAFKPLMGPVMSALKGKCDGKTISAILREELEKRL